jgi:Zn-dependent membrane protease YugP
MITLTLFVIISIAGYAIQANLKSKFKKYSKMPIGRTGRDIALKMLHDNGIYDVEVTSTPGKLTDHYNPTDRTVNLSKEVYNSASVAAAAVAAHECGHAIQHAKAYTPLKIRSALVPVVSFSSSIVSWVLLFGVLLIGVFPSCYWEESCFSQSLHYSVS